MDFKKAFDQTVREFKREVNKVLKVPEIEQKVLDVTSNEPWGPHGTVMSDIAQATRNYNDYQMIMTIIWKRVNDTGRNWRHVYKALTLLEFLVAHGSERVIDDLREHAYQLSTLADFQYIDSGGRDQGLNVRKKSQTLVALVNDKEKIREARQKAAENRDKYRGGSSTGGMYKPSSYYSTGGSYGGDRYEEDSYGSNSRHGSREDDRYGRDRDRDGDRYRDEDRYGRDWDRSGRDSDRSSRGDRYKDEYGRDYDREEDRYNSRRGDDRQGDKHRSYDRDRDRAYDDDDRHSSRSGGGRGDDYGTDDRRADRKPVDPRMMTAPPSYEEALSSPDYRAEEQRDGGGLAAAVARASKSNASQVNNAPKAPPSGSQSDDFDEFDPRASSAPTFQVDQPFSHAEQGVSLRAFPPGPANSLSTAQSSSSTDLFGDTGTYGLPSAAAVMQELDGDVFGETPFKAETPVSTNASIASAPVHTPQGTTGNGGVPIVSMGTSSFGAYAPPTASISSPPMSTVRTSTNNFSAYAAALPPASSQPTPAPSVSSQAVPAIIGSGDLFGEDSFTAAFGATSIAPATASSLNTSVAPEANQIQVTTSLSSNGALPGVTSFNTTMVPQMNQNLVAPTTASQPLYSVANQGQKANFVPAAKPQQEKKFETKSSVWADTLSKGLIDLNIAGPKSNPLADIGIDFDLLRTERIKEERATAKTSTVTMGKAMGSGSGLGLAGAGAIAPPVAPVLMSNVGLNSGMGMTPPMGMGMRPPMGPGMGMGNPMMQLSLNPGMPSVGMGPGMGMAMGMGMGMNPGMGMGMGMGMGNQQQYSGYR